ncbi:MAG: hypothetical protein WDM81_13840 [Rhizomicrobium sp.]
MSAFWGVPMHPPTSPPPGADTETLLFLILGLLTTMRRLLGAQFCKTFVVGEMRTLMGRFDPAQHQLAARPPAPARFLRQHCAGCGRCSLGRD